MRVDHEDIQVERVDQLMEAIPEDAHVVALSQDPGDVPCLHARRDEEHPARDAGPDPRRDIVGRLLDGTVAPQIVVQRVMDLGLVQSEQDMDAGRLDIGVDDANAEAVAGEERRKVGCCVRLPGAAAVRVDRDDLPQSDVLLGRRRIQGI
jgi:hypothetical protein